MKLYIQLRAGGLAAAIALTAALTPAPASARGELKVVEPDWTGGAITCRIIEFIIRDWGYQVRRIPIPSGPAVMDSVRAGETDYSCESWTSHRAARERYIQQFGGDGTVTHLGEVGLVGRSGYYVPRYLVRGDKKRKIKARASKLKSWKQLNKYRKLFATKETGKRGRLVGCPLAEWNCKDVARMAHLGLNFKPVKLGSVEEHWAEVKAAYKRGAPFIAYAWEPHWIHAELDLVEVKLPQYSENEWPATDWPADKPFNFANPAFVAKHPQVAKLIENMTLTNAQQAEMIHEVEVKKRKLDDVVWEWLSSNQGVWQKWIPAGS